MAEKKDEICVNGWHLRKEVNVGHILTTVSFLITFGIWASNVENRLNQLHKEYQRIEEIGKLSRSNMDDRFNRYQADVSKALYHIDGKLERIEDKLDDKADKRKD